MRRTSCGGPSNGTRRLLASYTRRISIRFIATCTQNRQRDRGGGYDSAGLSQRSSVHLFLQMAGFPFSAWLYRIAHNQIVDHLRKKSKRPLTLPDDPVIEIRDNSKSGDPEKIVEHNLNMEQLLVATQCLTEAQREVISLRFTSDLSTTEVARIMGRSEGAVKALQHSAIVALRKVLKVETDD